METGVLTGSGLSCSEALRPLAYSFLAELIHHGRKELNISQLSRVVHIFCINMHDTGLPVSVQMTCIRLLINLIEALHGRRNSDSTSAEVYWQHIWFICAAVYDMMAMRLLLTTSWTVINAVLVFALTYHCYLR